MTKCTDCGAKVFIDDDDSRLCIACRADRWKNATPIATIYDLGKEEEE
jgi:hypothetical protein